MTAGGLRLLAQDGGERRHLGFAAEGLTAGEHLVEERAEGENVRPRVDRFALGLFRRHVGHGPDDEALLGPRLFVAAEGHGRPGRIGRGVLGQLGQPEVEDLDAAVGRDHDVGRLEVAVDDPGGVGPGQPVGDLDGVAERLVELHPLAADQLVEGFPFDDAP